ncbi:hypothetical protein [Arthrobacter sp. ES3-54]|uniref:hypothetical protein n=1 Tax=Arthrobacter sp. ES3-54 TaxID=1502991 RepID=UPI0024068BA3|nr:hypothetical protein [Arthrobacter sp. ES3-54]MDF9749045.1 hypothetical protein [Arthrobacter sp. ES3-54]
MNESNDLHTGTLYGPTESEAAAFHLQQGMKYRRNSIIIGVIGLFLFGIAMGLVAIMMARRAEAAGVKATAGKILGVLDLIGGIIVITIFAINR